MIDEELTPAKIGEKRNNQKKLDKILGQLEEVKKELLTIKEDGKTIPRAGFESDNLEPMILILRQLREHL